MTREEKIEEMTNTIENWNYKEIVSYAMNCMQTYLESLTDEELEKEYNRCFNYEED